MTTHLVLPDCQVTPDTNLEFLRHIGEYIVDVKPEVIVNIGDFADMPSLSSYDVGKKEFEGRRYVKDIESVLKAQEVLFGPLNDYNAVMRRTKHKLYQPRKVLTLGNHENRINRAVSIDAKLEGLMKIEDLGYGEFGWEVHEYLRPVDIDGISYCHYFTSGVMGRPVASAKALLATECRSAVMGHVQRREIAVHPKYNFTAVFLGTCYKEEQAYLGPQGNSLVPGVFLFNNVNNGIFDTQFVSLDSLEELYG